MHSLFCCPSVYSTTPDRFFWWNIIFAEKNEWKTDGGSETRQFWEWFRGWSNNIQESGWYKLITAVHQLSNLPLHPFIQFWHLFTLLSTSNQIQSWGDHFTAQQSKATCDKDVGCDLSVDLYERHYRRIDLPFSHYSVELIWWNSIIIYSDVTEKMIVWREHGHSLSHVL